MANTASMGPPPSPKEPRRSGRRSGPSTSTSKSPAGSPTAETAPKSKDSAQRPSLPSSSSSSRSKRTKNEDTDDVLDENHKNGVNGTSNGRSRRKADNALTESSNQEDEEEEQGVTRCICQETGIDESEGGEFMAECEICHAWQHGTCMGYQSPETMPLHYYCEKCRPDLYTELLKKYAKRARQSSATSHHNTNPRSSRSHSPTYLLKQPAKRRNTMNSRDAAYDESLAAIIEASAAEAKAAQAAAAAQEVAASPVATTKSELTSNGHMDQDAETEGVGSGRRKRKRTDDDTSSKRTRSASIVSDMAHGNNAAAAAEASPVTTTKSIGAAPMLATTKTTAARGRRGGGGGRRTQGQGAQGQGPQENNEGDEVASTSSAARRQGNSRSKAASAAASDNAARRSQAGTAGGAASHGNSIAASRAYHNSHAYAVSQQPLLTSWGLPDYLSHLEQMLPTSTPQPLEVRGFGTISNGQDTSDRTTERGVKVKWPSKRMSVGDMNKRVRALVEWIGREQASAAERTRRREAIEKALQEQRSAENTLDGETRRNGGVGSPMVLDGAVSESPAEENRPPPSTGSSAPLTLDGPGPELAKATMKMMEELMEECISFQERFGPGAKKERERRMATS